MAFTFSSTSGTSGITNITVSATERLQTTNYSKNYTISNDSKSLGMAVAQKAYSPSAKYITISPSAITWSASESTGSITINSNDDWVVVSSGWIQLSRMNDSRTSFNYLNSVSGNGNTIIGIRCTENTGSTRTGGITAYCQSDSSITATTTVSQAGGYEKPYIMLGYYSLEVVGNGVSTAVSVTSNVSWSATTDSRWIRLNTLTGTGDGSVSFVVETNTADIERRGTVTVFNGELSVSLYISQAASSSKPYIILTPSQFIVEASGSSGNVISISANCDYDISADVNWITLSASSGSGNGSVSFATSSTADKSANVGNIEFSNTAISRSVSVERQGVEKYLSASTSTISLPNTGDTLEVFVYSNINWSVSVDIGESEVLDGWLSVSPSSGSNNGSIRISVSSGLTEKNGSIVLSSTKYGLSWTIIVQREKYVDCTQLTYTSTDGNVINVPSTGWYGANVVSNTYSGGMGVVQFDNDITNIPSSAFLYSTRLNTIQIPRTVDNVGQSAFTYCTSLTSITLYNLSTVGMSAFQQLYSIKEVHFNGTLNEWMYTNSKIAGNSWVTGSAYDEDGYDLYLNGNLVTYADLSSFSGVLSGTMIQYCSSITGATIGNNITKVQGGAFADCKNLTYIYHNTSNNINDGNGAFRDSPLSVLVFANDVTFVPGAVYANIPTLTVVTLGNSVTRIGQYAFGDCIGITTIKLPSTLEYIGVNAFSYCSNLSSIYCYAQVEPSLPSSYSSYVFDGISDQGVLHYPSGSDYSTWISVLPSGWTAVADL